MCIFFLKKRKIIILHYLRKYCVWYNLLILFYFFFFFLASQGVFGGLFRLFGHVLSTGLVTLLGPGSVWGVVSGTQYWAIWSNSYRHIFKLTKPLKTKSKNHNISQINIKYVFDIIALISSCNNN